MVMDLSHERACYPASATAQRQGHADLPEVRDVRYRPLAIPPVITDVPNPVEQIPIQSSTDLAYLKAMASEVGYVFYIDPGPVPARASPTGGRRSASARCSPR